VQWYQELEIPNIVCFDPQTRPIARFKSKYPDVKLYELALGNVNAVSTMYLLESDGGSSLLPPCIEEPMNTEKVVVRRWANLSDKRYGLNAADYNCCVIDTQGMELDVLRGMDDHIQDFDYFVVEVSASPLYRGEAYAEEVVRYLEMMGFRAISPIPRHDDMWFVKKTILEATGNTPAVDSLIPALPNSTYLNVGCGTRQFPGWANIDINPACNPDIVADWRSLRLPNAFADIIASIHSWEHVGCGEQPIRESWRVLKPGGSLIVSVPDLRKLADLWKSGEISTQIYLTNVYGPYDGTEESRHRWGFDHESLSDQLKREARWSEVKDFDYRQIRGADIPRDDRWILTLECIK
jgi:FkbM family methyltransferase